MSTKTERTWFDQGHQAFLRSFPETAAQIGHQPFYVCPLCLDVGFEQDLQAGWLSREDMPPKRLGGRKIVLTCRNKCNNRAGFEIDSHAQREADAIEFLTLGHAEMRAHLRTSSGRLPINLKVDGKSVQMFGAPVPKAARQRDRDAITNDFTGATTGSWSDFKFRIDLPKYSQPRAETSWLRSAYLAWFAALGYRFVFRPELDPIRARITNTYPGHSDEGTERESYDEAERSALMLGEEKRLSVWYEESPQIGRTLIKSFRDPR